MPGFLVYVAPIVLGYILGSILPAYFIARLKGFDIRQVGSGNPGTRNAAETMGYGVAVVVAIYDVFKGPAAILLSSLFGAPRPIALVSGFAALVGHLAPFYLKFKGGRGGATSVGIVGFCLTMLMIQDWHFAFYLVPIFAGLAIVFAFRNKISHAEEIQSLFMLSLIILAALLFYPLNAYLVALVAAGLYKIGERIQNVLSKKLAGMSVEEKSLLKRKWLRPFAVVFSVGVLINQRATVILVGAVLAVFIVFEVLRFTTKVKKFPIGYKSTEKRHISSMVMYLFSAFLTLLVFPAGIASLALIFVTFGDLAAWSVGFSVGGKGIFGKTWSGTIACFMTCVIASAIYANIGIVPFWIGVIGSAFASIVEIAPIEDDNFFMSIVSAIMMTVADKYI